MLEDSFLRTGTLVGCRTVLGPLLRVNTLATLETRVPKLLLATVL